MEQQIGTVSVNKGRVIIVSLLMMILLVCSVAAVAEEETVFSVSETVIPNVETKTNDELAADYINRMLYGSPQKLREAAATPGFNSLDKNEPAKKLYSLLKPEIEKIANGASETGSTEFDFLISQIWGDNPPSYPASELGIEGEVTGSSEQKRAFLKKIIETVTEPAINALMTDFPYELYWYDKTGGAGIIAYVDYQGDTFFLHRSVDTVTIYFVVADEYLASNVTEPFTVNTLLYGAKIQPAINNAAQIVTANASKGDFDKLTAYKNKICELTEYNYTAADDDNDIPYGNPWQMIWVFDGDPETTVVCEGYSKAFQYLCNQSTFRSNRTKSTLVSGWMDGGPHMWNVVTMNDGKNYLADVTNSDSGNTGGRVGLFLSGHDNDENTPAGIWLYNDGYSTIQYVFDNSSIALFGAAGPALSSSDYVENPLYTITTDCTNGTIGIMVGSEAAESAHADDTVTLNVNPNVAGYTLQSLTYTPEGGSAVAISADDNGVYSFTMPDGNVTVSAVFCKPLTHTDIALEAIPAQTYTGESFTPALTVKDNGVALSSGTDYSVNWTKGEEDATEFVNAGVYTATITGMGGYCGTLTMNFTINPAGVTLTAKDETATYSGNLVTVSPGYTSSVTGLTFTGVSASGFGTDAGTYDVTFTGVTVNETKDTTGNYVVTNTKNGTLTIEPAGVTLTANDAIKTYIGSLITVNPDYTCSVNNLTFNGISTSGSGTNAGIYDVTFTGVTVNKTKDTTGNYVVTKITEGKLTINPAGVTLTAKDATETYTGSLITVNPGYTCSVDSLTFNDVSTSGSGTNAGTYDVTFTGVTVNKTKDTTGNYVVTKTTDGKLTINKADDLAIQLNDFGCTYNGEPEALANILTSATPISETSFTFSFEQNGTYTEDLSSLIKSKNAGTYTIYVKATNPNYSNTATDTATLKINPTPVTLTANSEIFHYDGTEKGVSGFSCDVANLEFDGVSAGRKETNAGTYTVEIKGVTLDATTDKTGNYMVTKTEDGTLTIIPKGVTLTAKDATETYTGSPIAVDPGFTCDIDGLSFPGVSVIGSGTTAGDYDVTFDGVYIDQTLDSTRNYVVTNTVNGKMTISQAEVGLTWGDTDFTYNGADQAPTATATGLKNSDIVTVLVDGAQKDVGGPYTATASGLAGENAGNYKLPGTNLTATFSIGQKSITGATVILNRTELAWTGSEQSVAVFEATIDGIKLKADDYTITGNTGTDVGDYTVTITGTGNFRDTATATWKIVQSSGQEDVATETVELKNEVTVSGGVYQLNHDNLTAIFIGPENKNAKKLTIPDTVPANGKDYKVTSIKDKACQKMKKLTTVTIGVNVTKIGASAFADCGKLKTVTIRSAALGKKGFGSGCFKNIKSGATFKVPKNMLKKYEPWILKRGKAPANSKVKKGK